MPYKQPNNMQYIANALGNMIGDTVSTTAQQAIQGVMNNKGNAVSAMAQANQGAFNQASADTANALDSGRLFAQYGYNSAMMQGANDFTAQMWQNTANWNESMWEKQAAFNAEQAQIQREWQEKMSNTQYQRAMTDMQKAGLNPILAYSQGGAGVPNGAQASVGGAQMSTAQGQMASGGLLGANTASEGLYQGMAEWTGGIMNLLAAAISGISSAEKADAGLAQYGLEGLVPSLYDKLKGEYLNEEGEKVTYGKTGLLKNELDTAWEKLKAGSKENFYKNEVERIHNERSKKKVMTRQEEAQLLRYQSSNNATWKYTRPKG